MKYRLRGRIIALTTTIFLFIPSLANGQTARPNNRNPTIHDSQILPYLLNNPNENSLVRVRCLSTDSPQLDSKRQIIRDSLLQPTLSDRNYAVTIEVNESCRNLRINVQDDSDFSDVSIYHPDLNNNHNEFDDSWLTREGSGWYWLLHPR
ncbi:hypothetical protein [Nostoc sp. C117]|uniref:hypothetical protein n=1 Tax=Nostoc sp. C117 TaxID=3349875 RepID=UPI00370DC119